jgi:hypothetical protein
VSELRLCPVTFAEANAYVKDFHRNHKPVVGHKFSVAVRDDEKIRGVAIVGRPVARRLDNGETLEVNRVATDGAKNACSMLYSAAWRAAKALGYSKLVTYTLPNEGGASLRAAGWTFDGEAGGGNWNVKSRKREDSDHQEKKWRWLKTI